MLLSAELHALLNIPPEKTRNVSPERPYGQMSAIVALRVGRVFLAGQTLRAGRVPRAFA
jgi:hypothetical protein